MYTNLMSGAILDNAAIVQSLTLIGLQGEVQIIQPPVLHSVRTCSVAEQLTRPTANSVALQLAHMYESDPQWHGLLVGGAYSGYESH